MMSWMHPTGAGAWGIGSDFPLELQFWGYIGECEGFHLEAEQPVSSLDEIMWRRWMVGYLHHTLLWTHPGRNRAHDAWSVARRTIPARRCALATHL